MRYFVIACLFFAGSSQASEFRGYVETNQLIRERLIDSDSRFEIGSLISERYNDFGTSILDLLGTYKSSGVSLGFKNGQPNSANMLVWKMILSEFSNQIGGLCYGADAHIFNDAFKKIVVPICDWSKDSARSEDNLKALWLAIMDYDAPEEEYQIWRDFFLKDEWRAAQPSDVVSAMTASILMSPYFLLRD